jgi:hypothetical protein
MIVSILAALLLVRLGMLTVMVTVLALGLKVALFIILVMEVIFLGQWFKHRKSVHTLCRDQWRRS